MLKTVEILNAQLEEGFYAIILKMIGYKAIEIFKKKACEKLGEEISDFYLPVKLIDKAEEKILKAVCDFANNDNAFIITKKRNSEKILIVKDFKSAEDFIYGNIKIFEEAENLVYKAYKIGIEKKKEEFEKAIEEFFKEC